MECWHFTVSQGKNDMGKALTWHAVMHTIHGGDQRSKITMRYEVTDERGRKVAFITNTRATGRPASWQISRVKDGIDSGERTGDYPTAEDALNALRKESDN